MSISPEPPLTIVALGASAGGLEALRGFFAAMPPDPRLGFVVITHLAPQHESRIAEVLQHATAMPVRQAAEGEQVLPAHVYVIPPNRLMEIHAGCLQLHEAPPRPSIPHPIDHFMTSLAEDFQERAVGIVLSGVDHDGTVGLKEIKAAGGLTLVQDPASAQFPGMPASAIEAAAVDAVVSVDAMGARLVKFLDHAPSTAELPAAAPDPQTTEANGNDSGVAARLEEVLAVIRERGGQDFRWYRPAMLMRRVRRRMGLQATARIDDYLELLRNSDVERHALIKDFLISVTQFFRQPEAWQEIEQKVVPALFKDSGSEAGIRVWTPGCATGEESLSIAMLLLEQRAARGSTASITVFASDVDQDALQVARGGLYAASIGDEMSPARLTRYFERRGERYAVRKELREVVVYAPQDLVRDPPFSKLDLVVCRNVLIYFEPAQQSRLLEAFHFALNPGGFLFLGKSESLGAQAALFEPVSRSHRIFRRVDSSTRLPRPFDGRWSGPGGFLTPVGSKTEGRTDLQAQLRLQLGERRVPAAVLVTRDHRVLYSEGETARFLQPSGEAAWDLLSLLRDGPRPRLRASLKQAITSGEAAAVDTHINRDGHYHPVRIRIEPLKDFSRSGLLLVMFEDIAPGAGGSADAPSAPRDPSIEAELQQLRAELSAAERESEIDNAELRVANEEAMSLNEELQSSNEELQTSKEELQSMNEELASVNAELENKIGELDRALGDLRNFIDNTRVATVILDRELLIRRFTREALRLFSLIETDTGRPLRDITAKSDDPALLTDAAAVLADLQPREREVAAADGEWFLRRILPYRGRDDRIEGVVVTYAEISALRKAAEDARRLAAVLSNSNDAVIGYGFDGRILFWNRAASLAYGYSQEEALAANIRQLEPADAAGTALRMAAQARDGMQAGTTVVGRVTKSGEVRDISVTTSVLRDDAGQAYAAISTERDVTERLRRESELRFRTMADDIPTLLRIENALGEAEYLNRAWLTYTGERGSEALLSGGWLSYIHPDDLPGYRQALAKARPGAARFDVDLRLRRHDGRYRWMRMTAVARQDTPGRPTGYISIAVDIEERKCAEQALAGEAERKDQFLAMLAHELRNPLHPITNAATVIENCHPTDPKIAWAGQVIERQTRQLARLVEDLMDVARIARGKVTLHREPVDLRMIIGRARDQTQPLFDGSRQRLTVEMPDEALWVEGDVVRLTQIVANLLNNASKYSEPGTETRVMLGASDDEVTLRVIDQGAGISAAMLPHVFDLFSQEDKTLDRAQGGLGIGLSLVDRLVRLHGGSVYAESAGRGRGSEFRVVLPRLRLAAAVPAATQPTARSAGAGRKVLVVDDDDDGAQSLGLVLQQIGHTIEIAHRGDEALVIAQQFCPEVALIDIGLPGMSGYELARQLRARPETRSATLIAMTGYGQPGDISKAKAAGFDHHVIKPAELEPLFALIAQPRRAP